MLHADHSLVDEDYAGAFAALSGEGGSPDGDDGPLDDRDRLCLLLMIERSRGRRSEWAPYLASLPAAYDDPLWWDAGARLLLRGSRAGAAADAAERALGRLSRLRARLVEARARELEREEAAGEGSGRESASEHRRVRNPLSALSGSEALGDARWARSTVWSRAFNLPPSGSKRVTLLPVGDMLDHDPSAAVRWSAGGGGGGGEPGGGEGGGVASGEGDFVFETLGGVPAGRAVASNYGHKSNEELLVGYGFVLQPLWNDADFFHFSLGIGGSGGSGGGGSGRRGGGGGDDRGARGRRARLVRLGVPLDAYCTRADPLPRSALTAACAALAGGAAGSALDEVEAPLPSPPPETAAAAAASAPPPPPCIEVRPAPPRPPPASAPASSAADDDAGVPCPPETQLRAVAALRAALRARTRELGGGGGGAASPPAAAAEDDEEGARRAAEAGDRHREMALRYRAAQRRLAAGAEAALADAARRAVSAAALTTARLFGFPSAEAEDAAVDDGGAAAAPPPPLLREVGLGEEEEDRSAPGCRPRRPCRPCPSRVAAPSASWTWGVSLPRGCRRGEVLAVVPGSEALSAPRAAARQGASSPAARRRELAAALLRAAVRPGHPGGGGGGGGGGAGKRSELARRLAAGVPLPPSMRLCHARGRGGNERDGDDGDGGGGGGGGGSEKERSARSLALALLEGTALAGELLDRAGDLAREGSRVVEAAARALSLEAREAAVQGAASGPPPPPPLPEPVSRAAERAGAWALAVVDSAAIPGPGPLLLTPVLAPLASAVPRCFRGAAVDFEWVESGDKEDADGEPSLSSFSLVIRAAADLPRGIELRRGCALVGQSAFDVAVAAGLEALPALLLPPPGGATAAADDDAPAATDAAACPGCLLPEEKPRSRSAPAGHGGQAVWHCFEREFRLGGLSAAHREDSSRKRGRERAKRKGGDNSAAAAEEEEEEEEAPAKATTALSLARRAADACGLLASGSASVDVLIACGRPTPKRALAALALSLAARRRCPPKRGSGGEGERGSSGSRSGGSESECDSDSDADGDDGEARHEREATAALKRAGVKRLLRSRKAADAAAAAASSSRGAGRDDAAAAALEAERASDAFLRGILAFASSPRFGMRARRALRRTLRGEAAALRRCCRCCRSRSHGRDGEEALLLGSRQQEEGALDPTTGIVAGACIYRKGILAALREHAAALEKK